MASNIELQIRSLIEAFNELAKSGDIPQQTITKVNKALSSLLSGQGVTQNIDQISRALGTLKTRLSEFSQTETVGIGDLTAVRNFVQLIKEELESVKRIKDEFNAILSRPEGNQQIVTDATVGKASELEQALRRLNIAAEEYLQKWKDTSVQEALTTNKDAVLQRTARFGVTEETGQVISNVQAAADAYVAQWREAAEQQKQIDQQQKQEEINRYNTLREEAIRTINATLEAKTSTATQYEKIAQEEAATEAKTNEILRQRIAVLEQIQATRAKVARAGAPASISERIDREARVDEAQRVLLSDPGRGRGGGGGQRRGGQDTLQVDEFTQLLGSDRAVRNFTDALEKMGLQGAVVKSSFTDAASGITNVNVALNRAGQISRTATVRLNEHGAVVSDLSTRYQGFGQAISNNIIKVVNWAVALGVVYGSLNRLRELVAQSIEIQRELTEVQIATGQSAADLGRVFDRAADVARQTGSSITGVIEGYAEAFAAAGSIEDPARRSATAQILLRDSMVLAKLSGLEQAAALDILIGALRQSGQQLDAGITLIDKFVAVSKEANVSINTLASTYAIVGTAAEDVGLSFDELNALAATLAEATKLSADETGNAIRGFVSGFQSASAEQALSSFGIAVRNSSGELRDFVDLTQQLVQLNQAGVISDRSLAEISNIIGGGFRRGSQFATFLENFSRFQTLTGVSSRAQGDAARALDLQLKTLDTAITNLGNSFTNLANTLGTEGGLIDVLTSLANGFSGILDFISQLIEGLGKATPYLIAYGTALAFISSNQGQAFLESRAFPSFARIPRGTLGALSFGNQLDVYRRTAGGQIGTPLQQGIARAAPGAIGAGLIAGGAALEGDYGKAGAALGGAALGALITGGTPVGIIIGSAIASSLYEAIFNQDLDIIGRRIAQSFGEGVGDEQELKKSLEEQFEEALTGSEKIGAFLSTFLVNQALPVYRRLFTSDFGKTPFLPFTLLGRETGLPEEPEAFKEDFYQRLLERGGLNEEAARILQSLNAAAEVEAIDKGIAPRPVDLAIAEVAEVIRPIIEGQIQGFVKEQLELLGRGDITPTDFASSKELISRLSEQASIITVGLQIAGIEDLEPQELIELLLLLRDEERIFITNLVGELTDVQAKIDALREVTQDPTLDPSVLNQLEADIEELRQSGDLATSKLQEIFPAIQDSARLREARELILPTVDVSDISPQEVQAVVALGEQLQRQYFEELGISDETAQLIAENNQEQIIRLISESGVDFLGKTKVPQEFLNIAAGILGTPLGGRGAGAEDPFSLLDYRGKFSTAQLPGLQGRYNAFRDQLVSVFPQLKPDESDFGVIADDGFGTLHADMSILNLLMEELIDVNRDQLNGIYNLPTDATVFVPYTGAVLDATTRGLAGGGGGGVGPEEIIAAIKSLTITADEERQRVGVTDIPSREERLGPEPVEPGDKDTARQEIEAYLESFRLREESADPRKQPQTSALDAAQQAVQSVQEIVTRFQLQIDSTTTLLLDGRVIAAAVKQFLYEDLVRTEGGATVVRTFVV